MKDFHATPYDAGTLTKLELYRSYLQSWLPVWLMQSGKSQTITIADFFAGPGCDDEGTPGSPLVALKVVRQFTRRIAESAAKVHLAFNDSDAAKSHSLGELLKKQDVPTTLCTWDVSTLDFEEAFRRSLPHLTQGPNLLLLDQQGISFITPAVFRRLMTLPKTDFIFFIASSTLRRFEEHPSIRRHLPLSAGAITAKSFNDTHRAVHEYYKTIAQETQDEFYVGRFSIRKGSNIYGLIFGSAHLRGIEKFVRACWRLDPERGEANFDIDKDHIDKTMPSLYPELDVPKKLQLFQDELRRRITEGEFPNDGSIFVTCIENGFLPKHGKHVLRELIKRGELTVVGGQPRVSPDGVKNPRLLKVF